MIKKLTYYDITIQNKNQTLHKTYTKSLLTRKKHYLDKGKQRKRNPSQIQRLRKESAPYILQLQLCNIVDSRQKYTENLTKKCKSIHNHINFYSGSRERRNLLKNGANLQRMISSEEVKFQTEPPVFSKHPSQSENSTNLILLKSLRPYETFNHSKNVIKRSSKSSKQNNFAVRSEISQNGKVISLVYCKDNDKTTLESKQTLASNPEDNSYMTLSKFYDMKYKKEKKYQRKASQSRQYIPLENVFIDQEKIQPWINPMHEENKW